MNLEPTDPDRRDETPLEQRAKALFDERVATVAPQTARRLARSRAAAVAEASRPRAIGLDWQWLTRPRAMQWVAMASGAAAIGAVLVLLSSSPLRERMPLTPELGADDVDLVAAMNTAGDDIEMLEDLEFYSWLGAEPAAGEGSSDENIG